MPRSSVPPLEVGEAAAVIARVLAMVRDGDLTAPHRVLARLEGAYLALVAQTGNGDVTGTLQ